MPVESTNTALKSSFSLSSLRPCPASEPLDPTTRTPPKNERLYHSLTKQPRQRHHQLEKEMWRKSWGSVDGQDENPLSEAFRANYDYLMSQHILEKDAEERQNAIAPTSPLGWSPSELNEEYAQLSSWLGGIRDSISFGEENVADWKSRAERQESLQRERYRLDNFNEESMKLIERFPHLESEISHYAKLINKLWENVESLAGGLKVSDGVRRKEEESRESVKNKIHCLRKWMRDLKTKLKPLNFQRTWTEAELNSLAEEHGVLHRDIEAHSYVVSSTVKLCETIDPASLVAARAVQRKYYEYLLRSFEWKCYIETLQPKKVATVVDDSDGEPGAKKLKFDCERETSVNGSPKELAWKNPSCSRRFGAASTLIDASGSFPGTMVGDSKLECLRGARDEPGKTSTRPARPALPSPDSASGGASPNAANSSAASRSAPAQSRLSLACGSNPPGAPIWKQNTVTIHCKHSDTERESSDEEDKENREERASVGESESKDAAESTSSEDCLTYVSGKSGEAEPQPSVIATTPDLGDLSIVEAGEKMPKYLSAKNVASSSWSKRQNSNESIIQELVDRADEMVRCRSTNSLETKVPSRAKSRQKSSGEAMRSLESYDASSECTAEESDDADVRATAAGCGRSDASSRSDSAEVALGEGKISGVVMRPSRQKNKVRPLSTSCVPSTVTQRINATGAQFSVSESALNQMGVPKDSGFSSCGRERRPQWHEEGGGSLRRPRRIRPRKRSLLNRRTEACAENAAGHHGADCQLPRSSPNKQLSTLRGLVKSGSFSGLPRKQPSVERNSRGFGSDSRSGMETDEEATHAVPLAFRLGPDVAGVTDPEEDREKMEREEQLSLNSDQVEWDDYQEKYQSEAYSEDPPDPDLVKKVTEFGEDYRKYLDSQSECEETRRIFRHSRDKPLLWEAHLGSAPEESDLLSSSTVFEETVVLGESYLSRPDAFEEREWSRPEKSGSVEDSRSTRKKGSALRSNQLREEMARMRNELHHLARIVDETETRVTTREELEEKIESLKGKLNSVRELKGRLRPVNGSVHRFIVDAGPTASSLKEEVEELYLAWDGTFKEISSKLCLLQRIHRIWLECEELLAQFQGSLPSDRDALRTLELALSDSPASVSVREVARILLLDKEPATAPSQKEFAFEAGAATKTAAATESPVPPPVLASLSTEGSLSDSGISDSGSEQGMTEREKKLARLKRLHKLLESILESESPGLADITRRIDEAEAELRNLQQKCRDLLERTAARDRVDVGGRAAVVSRPSPAALGRVAHDEVRAVGRGVCDEDGDCRDGGGGDEDEEEEEEEDDDEEEEEQEAKKGTRSRTSSDAGSHSRAGKNSRFWRAVRASIPFHIALVALLCVAYLLEPRCCDALNNFGVSFTRQLRNRHPPPT